jgi:hypothetical protein
MLYRDRSAMPSLRAQQRMTSKFFFSFSRETSRLGDVRASRDASGIDLFRPIQKSTLDSF